MHRITIMSKPGCQPCKDAVEVVQKVVGSHVAALIEEVNITQDQELLEKYRDAVPVILVDGVEQFRDRVDPDKLPRLFYDNISQQILGL